MDKKIIFVFFVSVLGVCYGEALSNYDLSRQNKNDINPVNGFSLREIWNSLIGAGYGQYPYAGYGNNYPAGGNYNPNYQSGPGLYPSGPGYPGNYPGSHYPGNYPNGPGAVGPPGAHPGCPLCDSSVYSYCSYKQAHDACCCENSAFTAYNCRKSVNCRSLYANSCQEYNLISSCCCVDLQKNAIDPVLPVVA